MTASVPAGPTVEETGGQPLQDWMIAVIAGVAGVLLLAIVILALCCFKRRKKAHGGRKITTSFSIEIPWGKGWDSHFNDSGMLKNTHRE